jgi:thiol:disulfide interchange protein DsbA
MLRALIFSTLIIFAVTGCNKGQNTTHAPSSGEAAGHHTITGTNGTVWQEGKHYQQIAEVSAPSGNADVEVVEFFSYGCPYCYMMQPHIVLAGLDRQDPLHVDLVPTGVRAERLAHARLYYTLEKLGRRDLHAAVFDSIWRGGNRLVVPGNEEQTFRVQQSFAAAHGIGEKEFRDVYYSKYVSDELTKGAELVRRYKVDGIPGIVIGREFLVNLDAVDGDEEKLIMLVRDLVATVRKEQSRQASLTRTQRQ